MPLSEHEQRMLEQIESALYAEDPKFASNVTKKRRLSGGAGGRRRLQAAAIFAVGLALLIAGPLTGFTPGGIPIISLLGFLVMFGAGLMALWGGRGGKAETESVGGASAGRGKSAPQSNRRSLSERMEERFNKRFEQE